MKMIVEIPDEVINRNLEGRDHDIIEKILDILRSYNIENPKGEDFRCLDEIVYLLTINGYDCGGCLDF